MARGVSVLVLRTLVLQLVTAGVTVVLARLLTPADYGLFAIALSVQLVGQNLAELGLPAALVRMPEQPSRALQEATIGFMFAVTAAISATILLAVFLVVPAVAAQPSELAQVIAVTLIAVPLYGVRAVPMAMMDREMRFGRVAAVETADTLGFNLFALGAAIAGLGVFSLAGAVPFGAALGVVTAWRLQSSGRRPRLDFPLVRPLIGFGSQVGALGVLYLGRDLGFVTLVGAIGSSATAGFYAMAKRLFSFPIALSAAVSRVGFPALSKTDAGRPERTAKMIGQIAFVCGLPLAMVAGAIEPLIVVLLGEEWLPTTDIVLYGSLAMLVSASIASPINGLRLAEGRPNAAILAVAVELALGFLLVALLIGPLDETGIGIAMSAGAAAGAAVLLATTHPRVRLGGLAVLRAGLISAVAAAAGLLLPVGADAGGLIASLAAIVAVWLVLSSFFARDEVGQLIGAVRGMVPIAQGRG